MPSRKEKPWTQHDGRQFHEPVLRGDEAGTGTHGGQQISDIGHFHPERTQDRGILSSDPEACGTGRVPDTHLHRRGGHRAGQLHRVRNDCHCRNPFGTALYRIRDREGVLRHRRTPYPGRTGANTYDDIRVKEKQMEYKQSTT